MNLKTFSEYSELSQNINNISRYPKKVTCVIINDILNEAKNLIKSQNHYIKLGCGDETVLFCGAYSEMQGKYCDYEIKANKKYTTKQYFIVLYGMLVSLSKEQIKSLI